MIDLQHLNSLFDDEDLVRKYLERFQEDMPKLLHRMRTASQDQDWKEVSLLAHTYKCQLQYLNANNDAAIAYDVEKKCDSLLVDANEIAWLITQLENRFVDTLKEIQQVIG